MNVLAVGAHPDDVELGCGASLKLFKEFGHKVFILVLSKGEASGDSTIRMRECELSGKRLCVDKVFFGNLQDTRIHDNIETILEIEKVINATSAEVILGHGYKDQHQDHRNAGRATMSAARNANKVLLFESPSVLRDFSPQVFIDVSETFDAKLHALEAFGSQATKVYFRGTRKKLVGDESRHFPFVSNAIEGLARYRGFQSGVPLAEAFEVGKFVWSISRNHEL